jgi:3-hydroxymyristoyl/3-hydroxydecanoyl-(acyl carrier protein) dehydratases
MNTANLETRVLDKTENSFVMEIAFPMECGFFDGHFPELPLLPGVVQTHLAIQFSKAHLASAVVFAGFKSIKFFAPIFPGARVKLECSFEPMKKQLSFQYTSGESVHSKGVVVMQNA